MRAPGTVLVTGVSSFVGMHLSLAFKNTGFNVIAAHSKALDNYDGIQKHRLEALSGFVSLAELDITSKEKVTDFLRAVQPQLMIHHAGYATNYTSYDYDFDRSLAINVTPLTSIYPVLKELGSSIIITGSSAEYSSSDEPDFEDDACWPDTPYGVSKLMETVMARQLAVQYGVPTRVARLYIPYGPFDNPQKLIPQVVKGLLNGESINLSPCDQKRDFIYIDDVTRIYLALVDDMSRQIFDIFNIGSGEAIELKQFLQVLAREMCADPALLDFGALERRPGEPESSYSSIDKITKHLNITMPAWSQSLADNWRTLRDGIVSN